MIIGSDELAAGAVTVRALRDDGEQAAGRRAPTSSTIVRK